MPGRLREGRPAASPLPEPGASAGRVKGIPSLTNSSACRRASRDEAQDPQGSARPNEPRRDAPRWRSATMPARCCRPRPARRDLRAPGAGPAAAPGRGQVRGHSPTPRAEEPRSTPRIPGTPRDRKSSGASAFASERLSLRRSLSPLLHPFETALLGAFPGLLSLLTWPGPPGTPDIAARPGPAEHRASRPVERRQSAPAASGQTTSRSPPRG